MRLGSCLVLLLYFIAVKLKRTKIMRILFMWCYLCLFCQQNKQVVSDKETKDNKFLAKGYSRCVN